MEWRALTVCLLDEIATTLRKKLGKTEKEFPLVKVRFRVVDDEGIRRVLPGITY